MAALSNFLAKLESGFRVPVYPFDDELRIIDAIALKLLPPKVACTVWIALNGRFGVPLEVVNIVLAYAVAPRLYKSPFLAPRPSRAEGLPRYLTLKEVLEVRKQPLHGVHDWNSCFTTVCPVEVAENEMFSITNAVPHQNSLGLVTQRFDLNTMAMRFSRDAVVHYCGIAVLSGSDPETDIPFPETCESLSLHTYRDRDGVPLRRYFCLWSRGKAKAAFFVPQHFDEPRTRAGGFPPLFPGIMCWNNGQVDFKPSITRCLPPPAMSKDVGVRDTGEIKARDEMFRITGI